MSELEAAGEDGSALPRQKRLPGLSIAKAIEEEDDGGDTADFGEGASALEA